MTKHSYLIEAPLTIQRLFIPYVLSGLLLLAFMGDLQAQQSTASVNGTVRDASGAFVVDATIVLSNDATATRRSAKSNDGGIYAFSDVLPGTYTMSVQKDGFDTVNQTSIVLEVNQTLTLNFDLRVGAQVTSVTVQSSGAQLEASTAELGSVVTQQSVANLPLNGRNFTQLLMLTPGAGRIVTAQNSSGGESTALSATNVPIYFPAMHGQSNRSNFFMLDGINDNEDVFASFAYVPVADDVQEFKVQSHNDEAQFGGVTGGIVNVVTKSGTNELHGAAWEFNRNKIFSAANPFTHLVVPLNWNQYGANLGGPATIPHLYSGRNRTFFFGSYEGFRLFTSSAGTTRLVPTPAQLGSNGSTADFSGMGIPQIFDPYTTAPDPAHPGSYMRTAFPNNQIPLSELDKNMLAYVKLLVPGPNATISNTANYIDLTPSIQHQYTYSGRINQNFGTKDSAWFRYSYLNQPSSASGGYPTLIASRDVHATNYGVNYAHIFNSATTLDVQFGHNDLTNNQITQYIGTTSSSILGKLNFNSAFSCGHAAGGAPPSLDCLVPGVSATGYTIGGESVSYNPPLTNLYQVNADFSKVVGHHFIQTGFIFERDSEVVEALSSGEGYISSTTSTPEPIGTQNSGNTGNALASLLLGAVDNSNYRATVAPVLGTKTTGAYVEDQWKVSPTLTLNLGIRYDITFWPRYGQSSNNTDAIGEMDFSNGTYILQRSVGSCASLGKPPCVPGGLPQPNVIVSPDGHLWRNTQNNVQPRLGFSYQVRKADVLRGGYGIFYDEMAGIKQEVQGIGGDWPSLTQNSISNQSPLTSAPTATSVNPMASGSLNLPVATPFLQGSEFYRDPHAKNAYSEEYNFGIQHLINASTTLEVDYVGAHFVHITTGGGLYNVALTPGPGTAAQIAARRPYPYITPTRYDQSNGGGSYNGLEVELRQSTAHGLNYSVSYTWSKTMNVACDGFFGVESCSEPDPYHIQNDYSVAGYDLPQNLSIGAGYELPVGKGRALNISNSITDALVGGWQVNGIYALTSGQNFTMTVAGDTANTGNSGYRLVRVANPQMFGSVAANPSCSPPAIVAPEKLLFNPCAFIAPPAYTFGTEGRNSLRGDPFDNLDASLFKKIQIGEYGTLQFRAEAFNALNHISYSTPGASISTATSFGVATGQKSTERRMQLAVKYLF